MSEVEQIWKKRLHNPLFNTSYPLHPTDWKKYRIAGELPFTDSCCAFYVHIPFCAQLCSFCEYTRKRIPEEGEQIKYLYTLDKDIKAFISKHNDHQQLYGFDVGGGTPMALSDHVFTLLMNLFARTKERFRLCDDFEPSIEGTFQSVTEHKLKEVVHSGIRRISLGLQTSDRAVLRSYKRNDVAIETMKEKMEFIRSCGVEKINLDLMYGLNGQSESSIDFDLSTIATLNPDQVTLYELRTNMLRQKPRVSLEKNFFSYSRYYDKLIELGYFSQFGQNTFSKYKEDLGCSSYLRHRMLSASSYKGFGIAAQSMSSMGISYNFGKNSDNFSLDEVSYENGETYLLPPKELAAKYISIAAYCGSFSLSRLSEILGCDAEEYFYHQIRFVLNRHLMEQRGDKLCITREGFRYYGATFSLFSSPLP